MLRDWFVNIGEFKRLEILNTVSLEKAFEEIYLKFIGDISLYAKPMSKECLPLTAYLSEKEKEKIQKKKKIYFKEQIFSKEAFLK